MYFSIQKTALNRILAFILLGVMVHHMAGFFLIFQAMRYQVRKEMKWQIKQGLPQEALTTFRFSKAGLPEDLYWIHSHEFRYKGMMYDIVKQTENLDSVFYHCINDVQEEELFAGLHRQVRSYLATQTPGQNKGVFENMLINSLHPYLLFETDVINSRQPLSCYTFSCYSESFLSCTLPHSHPPPKVL